MIIEFLKKKLSDKQKRKLRHIINKIKAIGFFNNLNRLAEIYGSEKWGSHYYTPHYKLHLGRFKFRRVNLMEIGVGGFEKPDKGGNSLRMWKQYFPFGSIFSIDIYDKSLLQEKRIKIFKGNQVDENFLNKVVNEIGGIDIIIDDGSHINEQVIETFKLLFPKLKDGGIYVIEDTQTSYWDDFGGDSQDLNNSKTLMNFFKGLTDTLNNKEFIKPGYKQSYFDKKIVSMHFYHNIIFIYKGDNNEESNFIVNNQR